MKLSVELQTIITDKLIVLHGSKDVCCSESISGKGIRIFIYNKLLEHKKEKTREASYEISFEPKTFKNKYNRIQTNVDCLLCVYKNVIIRQINFRYTCPIFITLFSFNITNGFNKLALEKKLEILKYIKTNELIPSKYINDLIKIQRAIGIG